MDTFPRDRGATNSFLGARRRRLLKDTRFLASLEEMLLDPEGWHCSGFGARSLGPSRTLPGMSDPHLTWPRSAMNMD